MKKKFLILSAVLLWAGFSAHSVVYDLDYGRDWSYVFVQDAYQWDPGEHNGATKKSDVNLAAGNLNGSGVNGYDTTGVDLPGANSIYNPAGRNAYLKVTAGPAGDTDVEWGKFNAQGEYGMEADETSEFIYLSANIHRADGSNFEKHESSNTYRIPSISVKAYSQNDDEIKVDTFTRGTINAGVGQIDTLAYLTTAEYNAAIGQGKSMLRLFRANFGGNSSIKIVWEVTYPEGHANHGQTKTYTAIIRKNPNLTKIATLKDLRLYNADAAFPDRHDAEWESDNLLKSYDRDNGVYKVENVSSSDGSRLYFEADRPKATVSAKFNGKHYDLATQNATALKYIDIPAYGGLVELTVTAEIHEYTKTYSIEVIPEEPVEQPLPPLQISGIRLNGKGKIVKYEEGTYSDSTLWISRVDTISKKEENSWKGTYYRVVTEAGIPYYVKKITESDSMITTWAQQGFDTLYYYMAYGTSNADTCFVLHPDWKHTVISVGFNDVQSNIGNPTIPKGPPTALLASFALTNGVDTFKINDFRPYFNYKNEVKTNNTTSFALAEYNLSVPNVYDQTLVPLVTFAEGSSALVKYGHKFSKVTTINDDGSVVLTFSLLAYENSAAKKEDKYTSVKDLTSDGAEEEGGDIDSVVYKITLVSNQKGFKDVTFRYNSRSAEPVELETAYSNSASSFVFKNPVPDSVNTIYIDFDPVTGDLNKPVLADGLGNVHAVSKAKNAYYITLDDWKAGDHKVITLVDSAKDGSGKKVNFEVYKAYDLRLREIKISHLNTVVFERNNFKDTTEFYQLINSDFEIGDLLDTKVDKSNGLVLEVDRPEVSVKRFLKFDGSVFTFTFRVFREYWDADNELQEEYKDYTVKLAYPSANADLEYLATSYGDLSPVFETDVTDYEVVFNSAEHTRIRLFAGAEDVNATVFADETGGARNISAYYDLVYDTTYATVVVTASNGITKEYNVKIINLALPSRETGETGINTVTTPAVTITASKGQLNITSPVSEKVYVYSVTGQVISTYNKKAGTINVPVTSLGVTVIKGTSGWVKKVFIK